MPEQRTIPDVREGATITPERTLYPPVEPYDTGMLDVGDGNAIYYEQSGNPEGKPAVFLHGGPGGGGGTERRRFFDPVRYRIICLDQRNCGSSTPLASDGADLTSNTTWNLVADLEKLREHLGIGRWLVFGGSWGSTLALAYAETHPDRVTEMVLRGIFTLRREELDWYYNDGASHVFPHRWELYCQPLVEAGFPLSGNKMVGYHRLLFGEDQAAAQRAAQAWTHWEAATSYLMFKDSALEDTPAEQLTFARIENHYFVYGGFMREGQLIEEVGRIRHIPCVIVQGRYDMCCPAATAHDLAAAWPEADLRIVLAGHSAFEPNIASELVKATDTFAR